LTKEAHLIELEELRWLDAIRAVYIIKQGDYHFFFLPRPTPLRFVWLCCHAPLAVLSELQRGFLLFRKARVSHSYRKSLQGRQVMPRRVHSGKQRQTPAETTPLWNIKKRVQPCETLLCVMFKLTHGLDTVMPAHSLIAKEGRSTSHSRHNYSLVKDSDNGVFP
jgi:hypothetical protein